MVAHSFARRCTGIRTRHRVRDGVIVECTTHRSRQFGIRIVIVLLFVDGRHCHRFASDRKRAALHRDVIVRVAGSICCHCEGVGTDIFARRRAGIRTCHCIDRIHTVRRLARHRGGETAGVIRAINLRGIVGLDDDGSLVNCQRTGIIGETVVAGIATDSRRARHNLAVVRARVRLTTVQLDARQRLTGHQTAYLHLAGNVAGVGRIVLALRLTGVGIGLRLRGYSHCLGVDLQLAGSIGDVIVAGSAADGGRTRHDLAAIRARVRLTTVQRNTRQCIAAHQTAYRHLAADVAGVRLVVFALRRTIVRVFLRFGRDGQTLLVNRQLALRFRGEIIVGRHIRAAAHHLEIGAIRTVVVGRSGCVRALSWGIGNGARVTGQQAAEREFRVTRLLAAVVRLGRVRHGNRNRTLVHLNRARCRGRTASTRIRDGYGVVVGTRSGRGANNMSSTGVVAHPIRQPAGTDNAIRTGDHVDIDRLSVGDGRR